MSVRKGGRKMEYVSRSSLASEIAGQLGMPESTAVKFLLHLSYIVAAHIKHGEGVMLAPLGTFRPSRRGGYTTRDPKDAGRTHEVPLRLTMSFRVGPKLKDFLADPEAGPELAPERLMRRGASKKPLRTRTAKGRRS